MQVEPIDLHCRKSFKALAKKNRSLETFYDQAMQLAKRRFCSKYDIDPIPQKILCRITLADGHEVWKYKVAVSGAPPHKWPRLWLGIVPDLDVIVPLVIDEHASGYDDSAHEHQARALIEEYVAQNRLD